MEEIKKQDDETLRQRLIKDKLWVQKEKQKINEQMVEIKLIQGKFKSIQDDIAKSREELERNWQQYHKDNAIVTFWKKKMEE